MPEASLIDDLVAKAPARAESMINASEGFAETATHFMPQTINLDSLRQAAACCQACDLHRNASQTVFGEGSVDARIVLVGEQPSDREDVEGHPFVGPAGKLLDEVFGQAGMERSEVYLTNVVKHFKFADTTSERGTRRLHKKPNSREVFACRPWLEAELSVIKPHTIICLGATSAQALFGRDFRLSKDRGKVIATDWCRRTLATWHPAAILRMPTQARREQMRDQRIEDLRTARD